MHCLHGFICKWEKKWGCVHGPVLAGRMLCVLHSWCRAPERVRTERDRQAPLPPQTDLPAGRASPRAGRSVVGRWVRWLPENREKKDSELPGRGVGVLTCASCPHSSRGGRRSCGSSRSGSSGGTMRSRCGGRRSGGVRSMSR